MPLINVSQYLSVGITDCIQYSPLTCLKQQLSLLLKPGADLANILETIAPLPDNQTMQNGIFGSFNGKIFEKRQEAVSKDRSRSLSFRAFLPQLVVFVRNLH